MDSDQINFWIDEVAGASDVDLRCALESFCDMPPASGGCFQEAYGDGCCLDQQGLMKRVRGEPCTGPKSKACREKMRRDRLNDRVRGEPCTGPKSKACREKMRRDRLNDRFLELSSVIDPGRPPKSDKASILTDATRLLVQLRNEAQELKDSNEKLQEAIKDLKAEKNELRDEKMRLKADKERLEQQVKAMTAPPPAMMPHPIAIHPVAASAAYDMQGQHSAKKAVPFPAFPGMAMWQWMPPAFLDTTQDSKLWSPNA